MLDDRYRVVGIARVNTPGGRHEWYWTTDFGGVLDPTSHAPGESPQGEPSQKGQQPGPGATAETQPPKQRAERPPKDLGGIENGAMNGDAVWEQKARDGADLILGNQRARLGGYHDGKDDLRQKVKVGRNTRLAYSIKVEAANGRPGDDRLVVVVTNKDGEPRAVLERYTEAGGWQRENVDLSRFAGRTVYVGFHVRTDASGLTTFYLDNVLLKRG